MGMDSNASFKEVDISNPERVPQEEMARIVTRFQEAYALPQEVAALGLASEIYLLSSAELVKIAMGEIGRTEGVDDVEKHLRDQRVKAVAEFDKGKSMEDVAKQVEGENLEDIIGVGGLCIPNEENGGSRIYIATDKAGLDANKTKNHEVAHALARVIGLKESGFASANQEGHRLDEAVVELVTLGLDHPDLGLGAGKRWGEVNLMIESGYRHQVYVLESLLRSSRSRPMTIQDVAGNFFSPGRTAEQRRQAFRTDIFGRIEGRDDIGPRLFDRLAFKPGSLTLKKV